MKAFTDIQQSKKLAEILPLDSSDHHYVRKVCDFGGNAVDGEWSWPKYGNINSKYANYIVQNFTRYEEIPCWSLAALLDLLPNNEHIETTISRGGWEIEPVEYLPNTWWCEYEDTKNQTEFNVSADNPVDACVEMIIRLNEQKLL